MALFPMFVDLAGRHVLVVGGGEVAARKAEALLRAGARVRVFARALGPVLADLCAAGRVERVHGSFDPAWLEDAWLAVAATDDATLNRQVAEAAGARLRWVNVVDDAALSTYHVPALVDRSPLQVAISSAGAAPMLARRVREQLEVALDPGLGPLTQLLADHREEIRQQLPDLAQRRRWFESLLDSSFAARLVGTTEAEALAALRVALADAEAGPPRGRVVLLGCDARDAGRLTLTGLRRLNQADRLLFADGVPPSVRELARRDAHRDTLPPLDEAAALLRAHASAGECVVCLRVDGFDDTAGHRLADDLRAAHIDCELVA